jgi:hypothetical protein
LPFYLGRKPDKAALFLGCQINYVGRIIWKTWKQGGAVVW